MSIQLYPSIAKIKRNGVYENLPGFVPETGSIATQQMIATAESSATAQYVHNKGEYFRLNDTLYQAIVKINVGDSIVVGTNCEVAVLGNDVTHIANSIATYELGIATAPHSTGEYFMIGESLYVATADIEIGDSISTSTNCRIAVIGDELSGLKSALGDVTDNKNAANLWQSGIWSTGSADRTYTNSRFICTKTAISNTLTIVNDDTDGYKYIISGFDMSATYPGQGTYNLATQQFERNVENFITVKELNLDEIHKLFPKYEFRISLRRTANTDITASEYSKLRFIDYRSYSKNYIDNYLSINKKLYVAPNGSDANTGESSLSPLATVDKAISLGATCVVIAGGKYFQNINIGKCFSPYISLVASDPTSRPIFYAPDCLITESETQVEGYTNVYSSPTTHTFPATSSKIFQDGVNDASTLISNDERHPSQRGAFYRSTDTKITKTTATILADALTEIDESTEYKWFYDSANSTIYFSRPQSVSSANPLMTGLFDTRFFKNGDRGISVQLAGIEIKYMQVDLNGNNSVMSDCKVANACGGGIAYSNGINISLIRCEVLNAYSNTLGDGIHAQGSASYGEAVGTTGLLLNCWVHDNNDDGFSDHTGCETIIIGGLYEYNKKGGVLPTGGSCTCYDVLSRHNAIGFEVAGGVTNGRNGQQMVCYNCVATDNKLSDNNGYGFFTAVNNNSNMTLINCKAINNNKGYFTGTNLESINSKMELIDCSADGNDTIKYGQITISNTTVVT